jgi:hypothetical protein
MKKNSKTGKIPVRNNFDEKHPEQKSDPLTEIT